MPPSTLVHLRREPLDGLARWGRDGARHVPGARQLDVHAHGASLIDVTRVHLRRQREVADVAQRIAGRAPRRRRLGNVNREGLGRALSDRRPGACEHHAHRPDGEIPRVQREERPSAHELHEPGPASDRRVPGEQGVLVLSQQRVLHEIGDGRIVNVGVVDLDRGLRADVDVLVDTEGDLLADDRARLVDRRVQEVVGGARCVEGQLGVGGQLRRALRRLQVRLREALPEPLEEPLPRVERGEGERRVRCLLGGRLARRGLSGRNDAQGRPTHCETVPSNGDARWSDGEHAHALRLDGPVDREPVSVALHPVDVHVRLRRRGALAAHREPRGQGEPRIGGRRIAALRPELDVNDVPHPHRIRVHLQLQLRCSLRAGDHRPGERHQRRQHDEHCPRPRAHLSAIPRTRFLPARFASSCWSVGAFSSWSSMRSSSFVAGCGGGCPASGCGGGLASGCCGGGCAAS